MHAGRPWVGLGPCPSLRQLHGWPGTGVSLTGRVLRPLGHNRCRSCSRLFEKSFSLLAGPTESPIDQPIDGSCGPAAAQGPSLTQVGPAGEAVTQNHGPWGESWSWPPALSVPFCPWHDAEGCILNLKENVTPRVVFLERTDSRRWAPLSSCLSHQACLPPPVIPAPSGPPSSLSEEHQRLKLLCCLRGWTPGPH